MCLLNKLIGKLVMFSRPTILVLALVLTSCSFSLFAHDELQLSGFGKHLSLNEISGYEGSSAPSTPASSRSPAHGAKLSASPSGSKNTPFQVAINGHQRQCQQALHLWLPKIKPLMAMLDSTAQAQIDPALIQLAGGANPKACGPQADRIRTLQALAEFLGGRAGRIGLILPLTGPRGKLSTWIIEGMRAAFADANLAFDSLVILRDSAGGSQQIERAFADLILKERASLIIGGLDLGDAEILAQRSAEFGIPTILLTREREILNRSQFAFRIYPDEQRLAETLANTAKQRNWHKIAVLKPAGGKSDAITRYFAQALASQGGEVTATLTYTAGDFDSMSAAVRQLFQTDPSKRRDEYQEAYRTAREQAEQSGLPFDPRSIILKPIVEVDAVFLPDDFRTARHFAKLIKFQRVDRLPLIGNHEWRSPGLLEAFDELFEGAIFADFIGSYARIPASIAAPIAGSPYFINPQAVVPTDFRLIGYRTAKVASQMTQQNAYNRLQLGRHMQSLTQKNLDTSKNDSHIFAADRNILWPTYVFNVHKNGLTLERKEQP